MKDFKGFGRALAVAGSGEFFCRGGIVALQKRYAGPFAENVGRTHAPQIADKVVKGTIGNSNPIDVDDRLGESCAGEEWGKSGGLDPWVDVRRRNPRGEIGRPHCRAQPRDRLATRHRSEEKRALAESPA